MKQFLKILLLLPFLSGSQNYKADMLSVLESTRSLKNYSMVMRYKLYLDGNTSKVFQQQNTVIRKNERGTYCKQSGEGEFISNRNYDVYMDETTRTITLRKKAPHESNPGLGFVFDPAKNIDDLLSLYNTIKVVSNTQHKITYSLHLKADTSLETILVSIDKEKKMLSKIQYLYKNPMEITELKGTKHKTLLEIAYEDLHIGNVTDNTLFDEKRYVVFQKGKIRPVQKYSGYTLNILN